jgi:hypothetical protein
MARDRSIVAKSTISNPPSRAGQPAYPVEQAIRATARGHAIFSLMDGRYLGYSQHFEDPEWARPG